jgi:transposase
MQHVAIDLGGRESQVCVRAPRGEILEQKRLRTADLAEYLAKRAPAVVVLEACAEAFAVADAAKAANHVVRVVPATLAPALGVGARGIKSDSRDSEALSGASCRMDLPSIHVPSQASRERKSLCTARSALVRSRTILINSVRGWLRQSLTRVTSGVPETFTERVRKARADKTLPPYIEPLLASIDTLCKEIDAIDSQLMTQAKADPTCRQLMTVPGIGPVTATLFAATIDEVKRFPNAHQLESYLGLTPGEDSSSDRKRRTAITKAGSTQMRWLLIQAAHCARRTRGTHPMIEWSKEVEKRRGRKVAIVALARKLAGILFAMLRDGTLYDPRIASRTPQEAAAPTL